MVLYTDAYRLAFCQVTKELPEDMQMIIWEMAKPVVEVPRAPKKSRVK